ncbi:MAG: hypothetical protein JSU70_21390 [Phycisphaerales bacterium]|nr:MAG: hypothetical protein JSU70_21390 [Phycisphaerales bacterium]
MEPARCVVLGTVLGYLSTLSQAVVGVLCTDLQNSPWYGDPVPADVWSFDFDSRMLTSNVAVHEVGVESHEHHRRHIVRVRGERDPEEVALEHQVLFLWRLPVVVIRLERRPLRLLQISLV